VGVLHRQNLGGVGKEEVKRAASKASFGKSGQRPGRREVVSSNTRGQKERNIKGGGSTGLKSKGVGWSISRFSHHPPSLCSNSEGSYGAQ